VKIIERVIQKEKKYRNKQTIKPLTNVSYRMNHDHQHEHDKWAKFKEVLCLVV
jgi:hypothetical protein